MLKSYHTKDLLEAGCDEAGRGCIAGPVFAAAVILPPQFYHTMLDDSKKISEKTRLLLRGIIESEAIAYGIGIVDEKEIDARNILQASFLAMHMAVEQLSPVPQHLIIDGNRYYNRGEIPHTCIIGGDRTYTAIAAASVLAKTYRDEHMAGLHDQYPAYGWERNKGYPTRDHRLAVLKNGPSPYHRRSFRLLNDQMRIDFS